MKNSLETPSHAHDKSNKKLTQREIIFDYLKENVATNTMISVVTGLPQKNICREKRRLEQDGYLWVVKVASCKVTGYKASYLTTNSSNANFEGISQLSLDL